jgi:hypothetical protein
MIIGQEDFFDEEFEDDSTEEVMTEGILDGEKPPKDFINFAVNFFKKVDKKKPLTKRDFEEKIKKNERFSYNFELQNPKKNAAIGYAKAFGKGLLLGGVAGLTGPAAPGVAGAGLVLDYDREEKIARKDRIELAKVIESCGITKKNEQKGEFDRYIVKGDYVYHAWPAVATSAGTYTTYSISLKCEKKDTTLEAFSMTIDEYFACKPEHQYKNAQELSETYNRNAFYRDPIFNRVIAEHFDLSDAKTRKALLNLDEAGQNNVVSSLTSKLYDKIVDRCDDIDYGEIPATKGDITKLSRYSDMKETISIIHDLLKEYKQDSSPVDELSVAMSNIETRREMFERAYRYNSELPMAMYCNVVLGIITGISYMIATCIEFVKDPNTQNFRISLDKVAYNKSKEHLIYNSLKSFNRTCKNNEFDKAMEAVLKGSTKNFAGAAIAGGIAIGVLGTIVVLIPVLRELIFLFYYMRMRISDFFDIQADLLQMNAYALEANNTMDEKKRKEVMKKQLKIAENFRKVSNTFAFDIKKAEAESAKEKKEEDDNKLLIDDVDTGSGDDTSSTSALF